MWMKFSDHKMIVSPSKSLGLIKLIQMNYMVMLWCLTPCSSTFQLYGGGQFETKYTRGKENTDLRQITYKLYHQMNYER